MSPLIGRHVKRWTGSPYVGTVQAVAWDHRANVWRLLVLVDVDASLENWDVNQSMVVLPDERPPYARPEPMP